MLPRHRNVTAMPPTGSLMNSRLTRHRVVLQTDDAGRSRSETRHAGLLRLTDRTPTAPVGGAPIGRRLLPPENPRRDDPRLEALRLIARRMKKLPWTPALFALLLDELYVDDLFVKIVGDPDAIPPRDYARAVAVAIVLRHSWRPDDLEAVADRLGVFNAQRKRHTRTRA